MDADYCWILAAFPTESNGDDSRATQALGKVIAASETPPPPDRYSLHHSPAAHAPPPLRAHSPSRLILCPTDASLRIRI